MDLSLHDLAKQLYGDDATRVSRAAAECCDCGYRIVNNAGRQHDLLCLGRCLQCFVKRQSLSTGD